MDPIERINALYDDNARLTSSAAGTQAAPIALAAQCIVNCLLGGGKVLCCGNGGSAADAQYFAAQMQHRYERERPGLPAIALNSDTAILTAIAVEEGFGNIFAKPVSALGHPGDVLLTLSINGTAENMVAAIDAAADRQMRVIALTGRDGGDVALKLRTNDIEIRTPAVDAARILENHRLVIHCLCDLIDLQLMGG
ncbi:MAG: SIS domain-containing protein [Gammaproteobacteria bacterium]|nr:SIS domain-containing protein [Gammaproteobacteria bacterium]MCP5317664.1 SIS domain-containing protein [Chromatiaceae bacterium]MCW5587090.1 SIS domain-containing protein [Chromatiales bacterium]MCB1817242.1 SIS domain-containing protein [Gammaproteobacteria bacterium]MCP5430835.1 SIS domain-containing protein [Chromatiaceae bacterium]